MAALLQSGLLERKYNFPERITKREIVVEINTLDIVCGAWPRLDFIKLDVEGAELLCLEGGVQTILKHKPVIAIEYGEPSYSVYGCKRDSLFDWALQHGYVIFDLFLTSLENREDWNRACDSVYWDYLLFPIERKEELLKRCLA